MSYGWILTLVAVFVAVCALLAALGFRGRVTTVGIDLGTTFSVVGISVGGKVTIITDPNGNKIFPSVVSYGSQGEILTAYEALPQLRLNPGNTIFDSKRFIGRSLDEAEVRAYAGQHPFRVVETNVSQFGKVGFQIEGGDGPLVVSPETVGAQVLKHLMKITAAFLGHSQVNKAVMCVPAKFTALQRQATAAAFKAAGLKVVRVIEEPTAAAVAYRLHRRTNIHHILVYDFGGGTLDVSLLYVSKGSVQVYASDGDEMLGGSDLDLCLYDIIRTKVETITGASLQHSSDWSSASAPKHIDQHNPASAETDQRDTAAGSHSRSAEASSRDADIRGSVSTGETKGETEVGEWQGVRWCITGAVLNLAERIKKQLTYSDAVRFECTTPHSNPALQQVVSFDVTVADFESGCDALFKRALLPVTRLLQDLEMDKTEVDEVVLVGGSTRVPRVKRELRSFFGKELNDHIDPDVTVAYGAASILD